MTTRHCNKCDLDKTTDHYYKSSHGGFQSMCKPCFQAYNTGLVGFHRHGDKALQELTIKRGIEIGRLAYAEGLSNTAYRTLYKIPNMKW